VKLCEIETPALLVNLDVMERNLRRAADYAAAHGLRLRPHTKTHKTPDLGRLQLSLGAAGLTVAKVGEAEVMVEAEPSDLLVAYPVIGTGKLQRLAEVARRGKVTVALDSLFAARQLSEAAVGGGVSFGVLAEVDVGLGRVGVTPGQELSDLARGLATLAGLEFDGIAFYPGHIKRTDESRLRTLGELVQSMVEGLRREGLEPRIVSGGSTPTLFQSHRIGGMNEIRPGTYIFNDRNTAASGACGLEDCAAFILATVVSTARPGQLIIDGGSKTFSSDRLAGAGEEAGFGHIVEEPSAVFSKMNEEHGFIDTRNCTRSFQIGEQVRVIPNHICTAVNLHETLYGIRGEVVEQAWPVAGRGKLQ
jgi:D-serine deaminase-like pyridoxal phosphate-dependent protein